VKRSSIIIAVLVLVLGASGAVYAYGKHGNWHMTPEEKVEFVTDRVTKKLELSSQQRENFTELANTVAGIMIEAKAGKSQQITEVKQLLEEPSFNQARAMELVQQKTEMINARAPLVISQLAIFLDSLDAGQKQQLQELIEHRHAHHRRGHGER
jgi:hypothetical protein